MYTVYVLQSIKFWRYYIWYSSNIEKRIKEHNEWKTKSTKYYKPYKIVYTELYENKSEALKREKELKKMKWNNNFKKTISKDYLPG